MNAPNHAYSGSKKSSFGLTKVFFFIIICLPLGRLLHGFFDGQKEANKNLMENSSFFF